MSDFKKQLNFIKFCISKRTDPRFRELVMTVGSDPELVTLKHYGDRKPKTSGSAVYHIAPDPSGSGFFADFNRTLAYLYYAECYGLTPVIEYPQGFMYAENHEVNGTTNPWEYYFRQPAGVSLSDIRDMACVITSRKENAALAGRLNTGGRGYNYSDEYISAMAEIMGKYICLNEETSKYIADVSGDIPLTENSDIRKVNGCKVLGVHVRGTDFKRNYIGHPTAVTTEEYLTAAKEFMTAGEYTGLYLATDDENALEMFKKEFGDRLHYQSNSIRSTGDETVMKSTSDRPDHHYRLGLEVLTDAYILGHCDGLVAGVSQVSTAARIWRKSIEDDYCDCVILNKGINKSGEVCR